MAGTARSMAATVLGLVALQTIGTAGGSGRVVDLLNDANALVDRLLDPNVPAIPNLAAGETWGGTTRAPASSSPGWWSSGIAGAQRAAAPAASSTGGWWSSGTAGLRQAIPAPPSPTNSKLRN
jgi:hypothetical protein